MVTTELRLVAGSEAITHILREEEFSQWFHVPAAAHKLKITQVNLSHQL